MVFRIALLIVVAMLALPPRAQAQSRQPTAAETKAVRDCAAKNQDDPEKAIQSCMTNLVAGPCIDKYGPNGTGDHQMADCYYIEAAIWDALLNDNFKALLDGLDPDQTAKARTMQRDWIAMRDSTCNFFADKIRGSMAVPMTAECVDEETARRAILLKTFGGL